VPRSNTAGRHGTITGGAQSGLIGVRCGVQHHQLVTLCGGGFQCGVKPGRMFNRNVRRQRTAPIGPQSGRGLRVKIDQQGLAVLCRFGRDMNGDRGFA